MDRDVLTSEEVSDSSTEPDRLRTPRVLLSVEAAAEQLSSAGLASTH